MMPKLKAILASMLLTASAMGASAQSPLKFNEDGEFKIVQFTDTHFRWDKGDEKTVLPMMTEVIEAEKPDFIIVTGDIIYSTNVEKALRQLFSPIVESDIPFAFVFGNHDHQFELNRSQIYDIIQKMPGCVVPKRGDSPSPDYALEVMSSDGSKPASVLYCLDSHAGSQVNGLGRYAWLTTNQIVWYKTNSLKYTENNGNQPLPSVMFYHIPLPEVQYALADKSIYYVGEAREKVCCPHVNSGMFVAQKEQGDVFANFFGHDHDNDFVITYWDTLFGYGRYGGSKGSEYNHLGKNGARVIVLKEGKKELDTWLRLRGEEQVVDKVSYPSDFKGKKRKNKKDKKKNADDSEAS